MKCLAIYSRDRIAADCTKHERHAHPVVPLDRVNVFLQIRDVRVVVESERRYVCNSFRNERAVTRRERVVNILALPTEFSCSYSHSSLCNGLVVAYLYVETDASTQTSSRRS